MKPKHIQTFKCWKQMEIKMLKCENNRLNAQLPHIHSEKEHDDVFHRLGWNQLKIFELEEEIKHLNEKISSE